MGCCGQKRAAMSSTGAPARPTNPISALRAPPTPTSGPPAVNHEHARPTPAAPAFNGFSTVLLRYMETSPIQILGPATGRAYRFSGAAPLQPISAQDAQGMLATRYFRRAC